MGGPRDSSETKEMGGPTVKRRRWVGLETAVKRGKMGGPTDSSETW